MYWFEALYDIYIEHGRDVTRLVGSLVGLDVLLADVDLSSRTPWQHSANRIAAKRERVRLSLVHPLLRWKLPSLQPDWLTLAVIVKRFQLALEGAARVPATAVMASFPARMVCSAESDLPP